MWWRVWVKNLANWECLKLSFDKHLSESDGYKRVFSYYLFFKKSILFSDNHSHSFPRSVTGLSMRVAASSLTCFARMAKIPPSLPSPARLAVKMKATLLMEVEPALQKATHPSSDRLSSALPPHWTSVFLGTQQQLFWQEPATPVRRNRSRRWWSLIHKVFWGKRRNRVLVSPTQWQLAPPMASSTHLLPLPQSCSPLKISVTWGCWLMQLCRGQLSRRTWRGSRTARADLQRL